MSVKLTQLKSILRELFQLDHADLDFGIYRILGQKRHDVLAFIDTLDKSVAEAFARYQPADKARLRKELDEAIAGATSLGVAPEAIPKVRELSAKLAASVDVAALEDEVFSDLTTFFRRYYKDGDFLSLRRYKEGVYAIPYEGEEVKLHWANHDQYYIKSSEQLTNYAFAVPDGRRVRFELAAASTERDNNKAAKGQERHFILAGEHPVECVDAELVLRFEFRPVDPVELADADGKAPKKVSQEELLARAYDAVVANAAAQEWLAALRSPAPTEASPDRTLLQKHLTTYAAKHKFDYFIHKDLGGFLRRELDFFIKTEVLHLDDLDRVEDFGVVEQKLSKIRVLRALAHKVIDFLAQVEDFQKKLWLKKKFVVETSWLITLDRIPEEFYPEIAANDAQREEWVRLFKIDTIDGDLTTPSYTVPLTARFLKSNPNLVLDTRHFAPPLAERIIEASTLPSRPHLLINSDNFHALRALSTLLAKHVDCIYIDPPYNASTSTSEILYKNTYKHSSWLSLIATRYQQAEALRAPDGFHVVAIDENEQERLGLLIEATTPDLAKTCVSIVHNPRGIQGGGFSYTHEYAYFAGPAGSKLPKRQLDESKAKPLMKTGSVSTRAEGYTMFYPIYVKNGAVTRVGPPPPPEWSPDQPERVLPSGELEVWPIDSDGGERKWRYKGESLMAVCDNVEIRRGRDGRSVPYLAKDSESYRTVWSDAAYNAAEYGSTLLKNMVPEADFDFPKSIHTVKDCVRIGSRRKRDATVIDYFAGSGTTAQAVLDLNREDGGSRVFCLVEMGEYFSSMLFPRVVRAAYANSWSNGAPVVREGASVAMQVMVLESYEDTLDNLDLRRSPDQQSLLDHNPALREDYVLRYMLDVESRDSLLNAHVFRDPWGYSLRVTRNNETRTQAVDLVETFNFLIGLHVEHYGARIHRTADFERDDAGRLRVTGGRTRPCDPGDGWTFKVIQGRTNGGERALVIWRTLSADPERDNLMLDALFEKLELNPRDAEFDVIWVNGDSNLENLRRPDETWKVRLIEEDFHRLMFDTTDV